MHMMTRNITPVLRATICVFVGHKLLCYFQTDMLRYLPPCFFQGNVHPIEINQAWQSYFRENRGLQLRLKNTRKASMTNLRTTIDVELERESLVNSSQQNPKQAEWNLFRLKILRQLRLHYVHSSATIIVIAFIVAMFAYTVHKQASTSTFCSVQVV